MHASAGLVLLKPYPPPNSKAHRDEEYQTQHDVNTDMFNLVELGAWYEACLGSVRDLQKRLLLAPYESVAPMMCAPI
eukprot:4762110-Amphidinium_carterae.1